MLALPPHPNEKTPRLTVSNRMEELILELAANLEQTSSWLVRHIVVIPSPAMKIWVEEQLTARLGCLMGVEFAMLDELPDRLSLPGRRTPLPIELRAHLEYTLRLRQQQGLSLLGSADDAGIFHPMSRTLAYLFAQYGVFGRDLLAHWNSDDRIADGWQEQVWRQIKADRPDCMASVQRLELPIPELDGIHVHLLGQSSMPPPTLRWCRRLATQCSVHFYQLGASPLWCEDIRSGRELSGLRKKWSTQRLSQSSQEELEAAILEDQPLLADWGRLFRRTQVAMVDEWSSDQLSARFRVRERLTTAHNPLPIGVEEESAEPGLLHHLQFDLLSLRTSEPANHVSADDSLRFHFCQSRLQEAEVVVDRILNFLQKNPTTAWEQIIIASPVIERYRPLLRGALAAKQLPIPLRWVDGGELTPLSSWVQALLNLAGKRWSLLEVGRVLLHPFLGQISGWRAEDYGLIERFLGQLHVWWGWDGSHRSQWLKTHLGRQAPEERNPEIGTWADRLGATIGHLLRDPSQTLLGAADWPLLGSFLQHLLLIERFHRELEQVTTIPAVAESLRHLLEEMGISKQAVDDPLLQVLDGIAANHPLRRWPLPAASSLCWIRESLSIREVHASSGGIWVGSLQSCRGIPGQAIFLLGMDETSFPTPWNPEPFNELPAHENFPSRGDYDRLCLLEAVLGARERLEISAAAPQAGRDLEGMSSTISQLIVYLEKSFGVSRDQIVTVHQRPLVAPARSAPMATTASGDPPPLSTISVWELEEALVNPLLTFLRHQLRWRRPRLLTDEPIEWSNWQIHQLLEQKLVAATANLEGSPANMSGSQQTWMPRGRLMEWLEAQCQEVAQLHDLGHLSGEESETSVFSQNRLQPATTAVLSVHSNPGDHPDPIAVDHESTERWPAIEIPSAQGPVILVGQLGVVTGTTLWVSGAVKGSGSLRQLIKCAVWSKLCPGGAVRSWRTGDEVNPRSLDANEALGAAVAWYQLVQQHVLPAADGNVLQQVEMDTDSWLETLSEVGLSASWQSVSWPQEALDLAEMLARMLAKLKEREPQSEGVRG